MSLAEFYFLLHRTYLGGKLLIAIPSYSRKWLSINSKSFYSFLIDNTRLLLIQIGILPYTPF